MKLERSVIPLVATVEKDLITEEAIAPFDVSMDDVTQFFQYLPPTIEEEYNIGLIVGSSGSGKSLLLNQMTPMYIGGAYHPFRSIAAHFDSAAEAQEKLYAVGLNSVPKWKLPITALSNGEQHRAYVAAHLHSNSGIDEFTSVVDRTVARSLSVAVSRYIKDKDLKRVIFATCHFDVIPFLKPDWVINTDSGEFTLDGYDDTTWYHKHLKTGEEVGRLIRK